MLEFVLKNGQKIIPYEQRCVLKGNNYNDSRYVNIPPQTFTCLWSGHKNEGISEDTEIIYTFLNDYYIKINYYSVDNNIEIKLFSSDNVLIDSHFTTDIDNDYWFVKIQTNIVGSNYSDNSYGITLYHLYYNTVSWKRINNNLAELTLLDNYTAPSKYNQSFGGNNLPVYAGDYWWTEANAANYERKKKAFWDLYNNAVIEDENDISGNSSVGGGGGSHFTESDIIDIPSLPTSNMLANRMISCYGVNNSGLNDLASFLWSDNFVNSLKKLYDSPMQNIIDLSIMPIDYSVYEHGAVKIGNVITDASGDLIDKQFYEIDLGTLECSEIWGSALDYAPYTRALLYLPFTGYVPIDINKIMGTTISIKYHVDIVTGDCVAFVKSDEQLILMRNGNMKTHIELSSSNNIERYKAFAQLAGATVTSSVSPISSAEVALSSALTVAMGKPIYETAGNFSSTSGLMSPRYAFIVYSRPNQCLPKKYKSFNGYPSFITSKLADLSGFTSVNQVHLEGINATDEELTEIEDLLKKGVIL